MATRCRASSGHMGIAVTYLQLGRQGLDLRPLHADLLRQGLHRAVVLRGAGRPVALLLTLLVQPL